MMLPKSLMNSRRLMGFTSLPRATFLKFSPIFKQELCAASQQDRRVHVCFGSKADICDATRHVRLTPIADMCGATPGCPLCANSGHSKRCAINRANKFVIRASSFFNLNALNTAPLRYGHRSKNISTPIGRNDRRSSSLRIFEANSTGRTQTFYEADR